MMAPRLARWGCALPMSMVSLDSRTLDLHGRMDSYLSTAETQHGLGYHIVDVNMDVHFTGLFRVCPSLISPLNYHIETRPHIFSSRRGGSPYSHI